MSQPKRHRSASSLHSFRQRRYSEVSAPSVGSFSQETLDSSLKEEEEETVEDQDINQLLQRKFGWRVFLYLPFDPIWENFLKVLMLMNLFLMGSFIAEGVGVDNMLDNLSVFDLVVDLLVLFDNTLVVCGRLIGDLKISYEHIKRPVWLILTNFVTAFPEFLIDPIFGGTANYDSGNLEHYLHIRDLLKIIHVIYYTIYRLHMVRYQRVTLAICTYFITVFSLFIIIHFAYYLERCAMSEKECNISDRFYNIANAVATIAYRRVLEITGNIALLLMQATFSYIIYFCCAVPMVVEAIAALINENRHKYAFENKKQIAETSLTNVATPPCVKVKIVEFFKLHWEKNNGYNDDDLKPFLKTLALSIVDELIVDLNFRALKHSKLFQNMDLPFLRCVALAMEQTFASPGEVLLQKGNSKHKMIYVVSGIVQVLSEGDGDTAVLSLSAGSCLGETTLIVNYHATCSIVCKEYSVLQTLSMDKFAPIAKKFPRQMQRVRRMVLNRYGIARKLKTIGGFLDESQSIRTDVNRKRIFWLNSTLHRLMLKEDNTQSKHVFQNIYLREDFDSATSETMTSTATFLDLYAVAERSALVSDSIFHNSDSFPPILQPNSVLLNIWDVLVCVLAIIVCFTTPIFSFMDSFTPIWYWWVVNVATVVNIVDVYFLITTAVKKHNLVIGSAREILSYRFTTLNFWFDIVAAYPLQLHANVFVHNVGNLVYTFLHLNRCLKFCRVMNIFQTYVEHYYERYDKILLEYIRFILILTYLTFFMCAPVYSALCKDEMKLCYTDLSFMQRLLMFCSYSSKLLYTLGISIRPKSIQVLISTVTISSVIAGSVTLLMIATITSKQIMTSYFQIQIAQVISSLTEVIRCLKVGRNCKRRILNYVDAQWDYNSGKRLFTSGDVFAEMPIATFKRYKEQSYKHFLKTMPVFNELNDEVIVELCALAHIDILPPKEVISYKGESPAIVYYIIDGYVNLMSGSKTGQIVNPGESLSVFEAYLNLPLMNTSITATHCRLLMLPWNLVKLIIAPYDNKSEDYRDLKEQFTHVNNRIIKLNGTYNLDDNQQINSFKSFGYNLKVDSEEEYEYFVPFDRLRKFSFVQYMLLRVTFLPHGKFVFLWELFRSLFAITSAVLFTVPPLLTCWDCYWWWVLFILDLTALIDIYLKLHYCYYNDKGLLVTHPLKTAAHYIKHSFIIDVLAVLPIRFLLNAENGNDNRINALLHFSRCLQLYRVHFFVQGVSLAPRLVFNFLRYCFVLQIVVLLLASFLVNTHCEFHEDIQESRLFVKGMKCMEQSWFSYNNFDKQKTPFSIYLISAYIVAMSLANLELLVTAVPYAAAYVERILEYALLVAGYCLYIFFIAKFSVLLTKHTDLSEYQRAMYLLKIYMQRQKVSIVIQHEMIEHYELQWKKNRNNALYRMTTTLHKTLRADVIYDIYGKVLEVGSVFREVNRQFYRNVLMECKHEAFPAHVTLCSVNDIMSKIYIVYKGCVRVIAPDGTILTTLGIGSMFGNLDEYPRVRQTVGFVAGGNVELLVVSTVDYYKSLKTHPEHYKMFKYLTAVHIDYLHGRLSCELEKSHDKKIKKHWCKCFYVVFNKDKFLYKVWQFLLLFIICYVTNLIHLYMFSINEGNFYLYLVFYISDILYTIDVIYVRYHTAFTDETGNIITNLRLIRQKQNENKIALLIAFIGTIPIDVPLWFLPMSTYSRDKLLLYLRLNRHLRFYDLFAYLQMRRAQLNSNFVFLRCATLLCFLGVMVQVLSCLYIMANCLPEMELKPFGEQFDCNVIDDPNATWDEKFENYFLSFYVISSLMLSAGQTYSIAVDYHVVVCILVLLVATTVLTTFMFADVCNIMLSSLHWRSMYEAQCCHLLNFMKRRDVSKQMVHKVWNYVRFLWKRQNGVTFPKLLVEAPAPLKLKVLSYCYSHHITKNVVFKKCHEDFIRQLVLKLRMDTYFPGDYIVFKGDINGCMYFIHKGSVLIMSEDTLRKEDVVGKLIVGQSFGILQGLYPTVAHPHYYQAADNSDILSLNRETWMYLLDYFPASREVIYSAAETYMGF